MNSVDLGLLWLHVAVGLFFTISGYRKNFMPVVRTNVHDLIMSHHKPLVVAWAVTLGEFFGGLGLLSGTLTQAAAIALLPIMFGAYVMEVWPAVLVKNPHPVSYTKLISNAICNPEAMLIITLITLALSGGGRYSLDTLL